MTEPEHTRLAKQIIEVSYTNNPSEKIVGIMDTVNEMLRIREEEISKWKADAYNKANELSKFYREAK